jgi:hypothetical protein
MLRTSRKELAGSCSQNRQRSEFLDNPESNPEKPASSLTYDDFGVFTSL